MKHAAATSALQCCSIAKSRDQPQFDICNQMPQDTPTGKPTLWSLVKQIGPGIAIAATGVGAADLVSSTVAGSQFGTTLAWAIVVGALLKYVLNEGVARWHLATGTSLLQGWARRLGRPALGFFLAYLIIWSIFVCGGLMVASGLAANSVFPNVSRQGWGVIQAIVALALVWLGSYEWFERLMKVMIAVMFVTILGCALALGASAKSLYSMPGLPLNSLTLTLGLAGGVGGSVTIMVYGYWIEQKEWTSTIYLRLVRLDLGIAYTLTAMLAFGAMLLASEVLLPQGTKVEGQAGLIQMASMLQNTLGESGQWIFLVGFWGAAFSSLLGVMQGVPYLFADLVCCWKSRGETKLDYGAATHGPEYRGYLLFLALVPMGMLIYDKPIWIVVVYAAVSSLFLPILTVSLLLMNNRVDWVGKSNRNGWRTNIALLLAMGLFFFLAVRAVVDQFAE
jgi:Mn2+/Fe2+ NRAMP family transporter